MIFKGSFWMIFGNFLSKTRIFLVNLLNIFLFGCLNFVFWTTWIFVTLTCIDPGYFTEGANERHRDHCGNLHFDCCCLSTCFCCLICAMKRYKNKCFSTFYQRVADIFDFLFIFKMLEKIQWVWQKLFKNWFSISNNTFKFHVVESHDHMSWRFPMTKNHVTAA